MLAPQRERQNKLTEMAPISRVFAVLFVSLALLQFFTFNIIFPSVFIQLAAVILILYLATFGLEKLRHLTADEKPFKPIYLDYITLLSSFVLLAVVLFMTGGIQSNYKIIFLPTILFYTIRFGLRWGLVSAGMVGAVLAGANGHAWLSGSSVTLEIDIIYTGVFFLTAWLVGTMVEMERGISDRLSQEATVDYLTGLFNHRHLHEELSRRINEAPQRQFSLIMLDLDYFRHYNETKSHQAGDRLLVDVAVTITNTVGEAGTVFRFGSDEFAVVMENAERKAALKMAEKIRCRIKETFADAFPDSFWNFNLTASFGVAVFPEDASTREELLNKVDYALYKAKVISGNKVEAYFNILEQLKSQVHASEKEIFERLKTFLVIINARDRYTYGHSERVLIYADIIATLAGLPPEEKKVLQYGAYLHDIGKIDIDRIVLNKAEELSRDEWSAMKNHPVWGAEIIKQIKALDPAVPVILYHHERYDGKGYPFGLTGKEIPLKARILGLADSFDAMTVERPYKMARSYEEALAELAENRGVQYDPDLADLFLKFLKKHNSVQEILAKTTERF